MISDDVYKVGIYLRLSREDEKWGESGSITTQRDLLLNYIRDNNLTFVSEYVDDGVSGTTFDRVGFNQMIKDCESGKINMIITKDTSRLGRDHIEFGYYVERYFPEKQIRYVAVTDGIDTSVNSSNNDMLVFKSAFNDMYVKDISNKMRTSLYTKKRNGKFVGCYAPFGYHKCEDDKHKLIIDSDESHIVKRIFNMFADGYSLTRICDTLTDERIPTPSISKNMKCGQNNLHYGVWATRTISDILKNPTYIGNLTQSRNKKISYKSKKVIHTKPKDWIIAENSCPAIIDKELFDIVNNMFLSNRNRQSDDGITDKLLLRGLIYCKECGHTIGWRAHKQNTYKYGLVTRIYGNCNYWAKRKKQRVCTPHSVKYKEIENIVLKELRKTCKQYLDTNNLEAILKNSNKAIKKKEELKYEIIRLEKNTENISRKIDVAYNDKMEGNIDLEMYKRVYNNLNNEITSNKKQINEIREKICYLENGNIKNNDYYINKVKKFLELKDPSRDLISNLIEKIEIDENHNIDIYYKIKLY